MNFFCMKKHYDDWAATHPGEGNAAFRLDLREAVATARHLFRAAR
jgi:hypothetical protein